MLHGVTQARSAIRRRRVEADPRPRLGWEREKPQLAASLRLLFSVTQKDYSPQQVRRHSSIKGAFGVFCACPDKEMRHRLIG